MNTNNNANTNIIEVNAIEGLISEANKHLGQLEIDTTEQQFRKNEVQKRLKELQGKELFKLRKVFE